MARKTAGNSGQMTALAGYDRLECVGVWHPDATTPAAEVVVTFGNASLVIADGAGRPLSHWSLAAVTVRSPGVYAPAPDAEETLDIADPAMVAAIARVQAAIAAARVRPGRTRRRIMFGAAMVLAVALVWWLPGAMARQLLHSLPDVRRAELGAILLGQMQRQTAATCRAPAGVAAAGRLADRLWPGAGWQIVVLPQGLQAPVALPGRILVLPQALLADAPDPALVAGHLMAAALGGDPVDRLFAGTGLIAALRIVTQGNLPEGDLAPQAMALLGEGSPPPDPDTLRAAMAAAQVVFGPYAQAAGLDPGPAPGALPAVLPAVLNDSDWIALQSICAAP